jgi:hypothetical protein
MQRKLLAQYLPRLYKRFVESILLVAYRIDMMGKLLHMLSLIVWAARRFLSAFVHLAIYLIYGNQKRRLPPIKSQLLLQPATFLAKRIRHKQVRR